MSRLENTKMDADGISHLEFVLNKSFGWLAHNGWAGYDPYDIRGTKLFFWLNQNKYSSKAFKIFSFLFPAMMRRMFGIRKTINAKAVALLAHAHLDMYAASGEERHLREAERALDWLEANVSLGYRGFCWGYPFDWDARDFIPAGTPSSVVTAIAVEAFIRAYELLGRVHYLEIAQTSCDFIVSDLKRDYVSPESLCFSYTPLDRWHVHNANLFSAATLARVSQLTGIYEWDNLIYASTAYSLHDQRNDGAWYYWGPPDQRLNMVDHYHTGYVLRCLDIIDRYLDLPNIAVALEHGYLFYRKNLFTEAGIPKITENRLFPIDIHSCAEAIICLTALRNRFPDCLDLAQYVTQWTSNSMLAPDGHFYYRKYANLTIRFPFVRWSQAWMLRAVSGLLLVKTLT